MEGRRWVTIFHVAIFGWLGCSLVLGETLPPFHSVTDEKQIQSYRSPEAVLVFLHHNKAGGTTIKQLLARLSRTTGVQNAHAYSETSERVMRTLRIGAGRGAYISGDYDFGLCDFVSPGSRPCAYFTMLRDPRERVASSYLYCKTHRTDQLCDSCHLEASKATFADWVVHQGNYLYKQLRFNFSQSISEAEMRTLYRTIGKSTCKEGMPSFMLNQLWAQEAQRQKRPDLPPFLDPHPSDSELHKLVNQFAVVGLLDYPELSMKMYEAAFCRGFTDVDLSSVTVTHHGRTGSPSKKISDSIDINLDFNLSTSASGHNPLADEHERALVDEINSTPKLRRALDTDMRLYRLFLEMFSKQQHLLRGSSTTPCPERQKSVVTSSRRASKLLPPTSLVRKKLPIKRLIG